MPARRLRLVLCCKPGRCPDWWPWGRGVQNSERSPRNPTGSPNLCARKFCNFFISVLCPVGRACAPADRPMCPHGQGMCPHRLPDVPPAGRACAPTDRPMCPQRAGHVPPRPYRAPARPCPWCVLKCAPTFGKDAPKCAPMCPRKVAHFNEPQWTMKTGFQRGNKKIRTVLNVCGFRFGAPDRNRTCITPLGGESSIH